MNHLRRICVAAALLVGACSSTLPGDIPGYDSRCVRMNPTPIARTEPDPHNGVKNVYACNVPMPALEANQRPFPDGAIIVKESRRDGQAHVWLIATARKQGGTWKWNEYTRSEANGAFKHILAPESVCTGCHDRVDDQDWIFTSYAR